MKLFEDGGERGYLTELDALRLFRNHRYQRRASPERNAPQQLLAYAVAQGRAGHWD
jgi:hypothetical protein